MPRPKLSVASYRHYKPNGRARVTINGRDIWLGKWNTPESRSAYARVIADLEANGSAMPRPMAAPSSVAALVAAYLDNVEKNGLYMKNGKTTSERLCLGVAFHPLVRLFGTIPAEDFGPRSLITVRNELCKPRPAEPGEKRRRIHTKPIVCSSVNKHVDRIRRLYRWAVSPQANSGDVS